MGNLRAEEVTPSGCQVLYVSGMPGTGKTASVLDAAKRLEKARQESRDIVSQRTRVHAGRRDLLQSSDFEDFKLQFEYSDQVRIRKCHAES